MTFRNFDLIQLQGDFFCFGPFLKAYNFVGNQGINRKFYGLNNLTIDLQKTDIWENLIFTWLPDWMSKIIKIWKYKHNKYTEMIHKNDTHKMLKYDTVLIKWFIGKWYIKKEILKTRILCYIWWWSCVISGFDLSFWSAVVKIYPFTIWYSVNKGGKVKNIAQQVFPGHRTIYLQHIFHSYWKQIYCLKLLFLLPNQH